MSKLNKLIENGVKSLMVRNLEEKAVSKNQQQFMGMVHAYKKGEMKDAPASVKKAAKGMTKKAAKDFASTKHKGLPTRVDESVVGDILIIADENNTYEKFTAELIKQKYIMPDELEDPETEKELRAMYDGVKDGSSINEALAPTNDLKSKMPDHVKGWAKWVAQHSNGEWWYYDSIPRLVPGTGWKNNDRDGYQFGSGIKTAPQGWEKSSQELKENKMIKEYTDKNFSGRELINKVNSKKPDAEGAKFIEEFFPNGFKSQQKAVQALRASDASPIKKRMGQYAPMFVHVQFHEFTDQAGEKYGVHQTQYYNSNFKDKPGGENFNPSVTELYIYKRKDPNNPSPQAQKDQAIGTILVKTDEYIKDLELLRRGGQLGQRVSESTKENKMNTKTESIVKRLKEDTEYQKFFKSAMDKFGVKSPKELSDKKKKEFFNYVDKNYKAKSEVKITEEYFPAHAQDSAELKKAKAALANWFNNIKSGDVSMRTKVQQLDVLSDLIDDYAYEYAQDWASGNMI